MKALNHLVFTTQSSGWNYCSDSPVTLPWLKEGFPK